MKRIVMFFIVFCFSTALYAQTTADSGAYPIPGSHILAPRWKALRAKLGAVNKIQSINAGVHAATLGYTLGGTTTFYATDLPADTEYSISATCRAIGTNCYVFAEDSTWNAGRITLAAVNSIRAAFDSTTPANASKGVFQTDTSYYGAPPNVDGDPKIVILILNIRDGYAGSGGYVAGYFYEINEYTETILHLPAWSGGFGMASNRHSNSSEIYYVDCRPGNLLSTNGILTAMSVTAHEFQHMIHWNYDNNDLTATFINEGLSECASALCGYGLRSPSLYAVAPNVRFFYWNGNDNSKVLADYARAALFNWYVIEQFGSSVAKYIEFPYADSLKEYTMAFQSAGSSMTFTDVLKNFSVAVGLNRKSYNTKYGFSASLATAPTPSKTYYGDTVAATTDSVLEYGTEYIKFSKVKNLYALFSSSASIAVQAIVTDTVIGVRVDSVVLGTTYSLPSSDTCVLFAVTNLSPATSKFTYQAGGAALDEAAFGGQLSPGTFVLEQNYPNPFNPSTVIRYQLAADSRVSLSVFDVLGRKVATLADEMQTAGTHTVNFDGRRISSGLYFCRMQAVSSAGQLLYTSSKKLLLLK
jgi:hypothetical protein